jgi:hypothetical protein
VARIRCCGNTKASWLLSWRSGLPFWVPGALSLGGSQCITLHGLFDEQLSELDEDLDLLITATATHGQSSVLPPETGTHWTRETRRFGPAKFHQRPSLHVHLKPSTITTRMVQLLEKRLTSSRLRTKVHQSQRRDTIQALPFLPVKSVSLLFYNNLILCRGRRILIRPAGRPAELYCLHISTAGPIRAAEWLADGASPWTALLPLHA